MTWQSRFGLPHAWDALKVRLLERDDFSDQVVNIVTREEPKTHVFWHHDPDALAIISPARRLLMGGMTEACAEDLARFVTSEILPGVAGYQPEVGSFASAWISNHPALHAHPFQSLIHHDLPELHAPRPCSGAPRQVTQEDLDLALIWFNAFIDEVDGGPSLSRAALSQRIEREYLWFWCAHGEPVCMAGMNRVSATKTRIAAVYTPVENRGRGYASALVYHLAAIAFSKGRCTLFTDAANPTSNKIYTSLGFRPITDFQVWDFLEGGQAPTSPSS